MSPTYSCLPLIQQKHKQHDNDKEEWMMRRRDRFLMKSPSEQFVK